MPLLYKAFNLLWGPQIAWRAAFFVPGGLQVIAGMLVLVLADDTPEGRLSELKRCVCVPACQHSIGRVRLLKLCARTGWAASACQCVQEPLHVQPLQIRQLDDMLLYKACVHGLQLSGRAGCRDWCRCHSSAGGGGCHRTNLAGWQAALLNPRPYLLAGAYAACFGVELTVANIVTLYLYNQFHLSLTTAGVLGKAEAKGCWLGL